MNQPLRIVLQSILRLVIGTALFVLPAAIFYLDACSGWGVSEGRCVESAQLGALCLSGLLLCIAAWRSARQADGMATALLFVAMGVGLMVVRELDGFFDKVFFHGSWKVFALPFLLAALAVMLGRRRKWLDSVAALLETRTGILLEVFLLTLLVFSRMFGTKAIWSELFTETITPQLTEEQAPFAARITKNAVEEVTELFAYMQLVGASFTALCSGRGGSRPACPQRGQEL